jgi:hypothetical protein
MFLIFFQKGFSVSFSFLTDFGENIFFLKSEPSFY